MGSEGGRSAALSGLAREERDALAATLREIKQAVAGAVTGEFYRLHPDWDARFGERGREFCREDEGFHLEFLASAVESGLPTMFTDYIRWAAGVLSFRGMEPRFLANALELIEKALATRLDPTGHAVVHEYLQAGRAAARESRPEEAVPAGGETLALTRELFLQALLRGLRKPACTIVLEAVRQGHPVTDVYVEVLQEALYEVGRLWEANRITVAVEHTATAIVQLVLAQLYPLLPASGEPVGNAVVTGVEGELHQVGAHMVADFLESSGWNVRFLGTNMPHAGILRAVEEHAARAIGISATTLLSLPRVRRLVADLRKTFQDRCPRIVVGGRAFSTAPSLAVEIGADACGTDLLSAPAMFAGRKD